MSRMTFVFLVLLAVVVVACSTPTVENQASTSPNEEAVVDSFDQTLVGAAAESDPTTDLDSLDNDLSGFE